MKRILLVLVAAVILFCGCNTDITDDYETQVDAIQRAYGRAKDFELRFGVYSEGYAYSGVYKRLSNGSAMSYTETTVNGDETVYKSAYLENGVYYLNDGSVKIAVAQGLLNSVLWMVDMTVPDFDEISKGIAPYYVFGSAKAQHYSAEKVFYVGREGYRFTLTTSYLDSRFPFTVPESNLTLESFSGEIEYILEDGFSEAVLRLDNIYRKDYNATTHKVRLSLSTNAVPDELSEQQKALYSF